MACRPAWPPSPRRCWPRHAAGARGRQAASRSCSSPGFCSCWSASLLGFLWHNRPPARIFMGDAGSYFIGFWLAVMTILATFSGPGMPRHAILAPLCVLAVPIYDTLSVRLHPAACRTQPFRRGHEPLFAPPGRAGADQDAGRADDLPDHRRLRTGSPAAAQVERGRGSDRGAGGRVLVGRDRDSGDHGPPQIRRLTSRVFRIARSTATISQPSRDNESADQETTDSRRPLAGRNCADPGSWAVLSPPASPARSCPAKAWPGSATGIPSRCCC